MKTLVRVQPDDALVWEAVVADEIFSIYDYIFGAGSHVGSTLAKIHLIYWHEILAGNLSNAIDVQSRLRAAFPELGISNGLIAEIDLRIKTFLLGKWSATDKIQATKLGNETRAEDISSYGITRPIAA